MKIESAVYPSKVESGFAIGVIFLTMILLVALVGALAVSSSGQASTSDLERARTQASGLITQSEILQNALMRYAATGGQIDSSTSIADLQALGYVSNSFGTSMAGSAAGSWVIEDNFFDVLGYNDERYVMVKIVNVDPSICQQVNHVLNKDASVITFTSANLNGLESGLSPEQINAVQSISKGCRNYNSGGFVEENTFIQFIPKV